MTCRQVRHLAGRYVDEELSPEEQGAVSQHLLGCSACAAAVQRQRLAATTVATLPRSVPSAAVRAAVLARPPAAASRRDLVLGAGKVLVLGAAGTAGLAFVVRTGEELEARRASGRDRRLAQGAATPTSAMGASLAPAAATLGPPATALPPGLVGSLGSPRIAFVGQQPVQTGSPGHSELWVTSLDPETPFGVVQRDDTFLQTPAWSADGTKLYYVSGVFDLTELDLATGQRTVRYTLPHPSNFGISEIFPAPDGHAVAFLLAGGMDDWQICVLPTSAGEPTKLHKGSAASGLALAGWQQGTEKLLYQENGALWTLDPVTDRATRLLALPSTLGRFAMISPDARQALEVVFLDPQEQGDPRRSDLTIVDLTSGKRRNLTNGFVYNVGTPSWSDDGAWIAFTTSPAWSPGQPQPTRDLWLMRANGSERRNVTDGKYANVAGAAVWTPLPAVSSPMMATTTATPGTGPVPVQVLSEDRSWLRPDPLQMAQTVWQDKRYTVSTGADPAALSFYTHHFVLFTTVSASGASRALDLTGLAGDHVPNLGMNNANTALMQGQDVVVWVFGYTITGATIVDSTLTLSVQPNVTTERGYAIVQVRRPVADHWTLRCAMGTQEVARTVVDARQSRADPLDEPAPDAGVLPAGLPRPEEGHVLLGPADHGTLTVQPIGGRQQATYVSYLALVAPGATAAQVGTRYAAALHAAGFRTLPTTAVGKAMNLMFHGAAGTAAADLALGLAVIAAPVATTGTATVPGTAEIGMTFSYADGPGADAVHPLLVEGKISAIAPMAGRIIVRRDDGSTIAVAWAQGALVTFPAGRTTPLPGTDRDAWPSGLAVGTKVRAGGQRWLATTAASGAALLAVWIDVQP